MTAPDAPPANDVWRVVLADGLRAQLAAATAEGARLRATLADNDLLLEERERQLTAALTDVAELRATLDALRTHAPQP